ncbi:hypothetical protein WDZ92_45820, partial [Nostoc sp. NIES-2111]
GLKRLNQPTDKRINAAARQIASQTEHDRHQFGPFPGLSHNREQPQGSLRKRAISKASAPEV